MKPSHHLDDATLVSFSAGALPLALSLVVAAHLEVCAECRRRQVHAERIGGLLLEHNDETVALPNAGARAAMLARLDDVAAATDDAPSLPVPTPVTPKVVALPHADPDLLPRSVQPYFGERISALRWRWLAPGVRCMRALGEADSSDGSLLLLKVSPGFSMPVHTHGNSELTLVLQGAYGDELGRFGPGDMADIDSDTEHQPIAEVGGPCICLAATDAPLRFRHWAPRLLQPLFRI